MNSMDNSQTLIMLTKYSNHIVSIHFAIPFVIILSFTSPFILLFRLSSAYIVEHQHPKHPPKPFPSEDGSPKTPLENGSPRFSHQTGP